MREHMNNFKNFAPYTPGEDKRELVDAGVLFLLDEMVTTGMNVKSYFRNVQR